MRSFSIVGIPETFVLDRRGHLAALRRGPAHEGLIRERLIPPPRERT